jgi:hypothetical protein
MIDDLTINRFATFADLMHYMDGSAIPVGRIMSHILGVKTGEVANVYLAADSLSIAMQLSNFCRDIGQDWGIGRIYIPENPDQLPPPVTLDESAGTAASSHPQSGRDNAAPPLVLASVFHLLALTQLPHVLFPLQLGVSPANTKPN